jgi:hypothetical protein
VILIRVTSNARAGNDALGLSRREPGADQFGR